MLGSLLRLLRPPNIITAVADGIAGMVIAMSVSGFPRKMDPDFVLNLLLFLLIPACLYGGGVVMNDVADRKIDSVERPERPIPSGKISAITAAFFGLSLLAAAIIISVFFGERHFILAVSIAVLALVYDFFGKHHLWLGPLNMGMCRGLNLLLGIALSASAFEKYFWIGAIPVLFISAITMISRGEVLGGSRPALKLAGIMFAGVIAAIIFIPFHYDFPAGNIPYALLFLTLFALMIYIPLYRAHLDPKPGNIRSAVKNGVLSLIIMDASLAAAFGGWLPALIILLLLPLSLFLARIFAVT